MQFLRLRNVMGTQTTPQTRHWLPCDRFTGVNVEPTFDPNVLCPVSCYNTRQVFVFKVKDCPGFCLGQNHLSQSDALIPPNTSGHMGRVREMSRNWHMIR